MKLDKLIGLVRSGTGKPLNVDNDSKSDLFVDQLEGVNLKVVPDALIWDELNKARREAVLNVRADLGTLLGARAKGAKVPYLGTIGGLAYRGRVDTGSEGMTLSRKSIPGALMTISKVGAILASEATARITFPVIVSTDDQGNHTLEDRTFECVCAAYTPSFLVLPSPVLVPFDGSDFVVKLELPNGVQALDNRLLCGCGQKDVVLQSYTGQLSDSAGGVILDASIVCDPLSTVSANQYVNPNFDLVLAFALRFKTGELFIEAAIAANRINIFTLSGLEGLWGKRNHFRKEYTTRLQYLAGEDGLDLNLGGCLICREDPGFQLRKGRLLI